MIGAAPLKADHARRNMGSTKFLSWANPFLEALRKTAPPVATARRVPEGTRVYCVGDIHGRDDLLREMAERVEVDMKTRTFDHAVTVFLGDYVDRGLGSFTWSSDFRAAIGQPQSYRRFCPLSNLCKTLEFIV